MKDLSEGSIISETEEPITINSLYQDLIKLGVNRGDILLKYIKLLDEIFKIGLTL